MGRRGQQQPAMIQLRVGNLQQQTPEESAPADRLAEMLQRSLESAGNTID
jgi:hypothetical protein